MPLSIAVCKASRAAPRRSSKCSFKSLSAPFFGSDTDLSVIITKYRRCSRNIGAVYFAAHVGETADNAAARVVFVFLCRYHRDLRRDGAQEFLGRRAAAAVVSHIEQIGAYVGAACEYVLFRLFVMSPVKSAVKPLYVRRVTTELSLEFL